MPPDLEYSWDYGFLDPLAMIAQRNLRRLVPYVYLKPSKIPASTSV